MDGVFTGVLDFYAAEMTTPETASTAPVYGVPAVVGMAIEATITPTYTEAKLDASNVRIKSKKKITAYTISMNAANIAPAMLKKLLGRGADSNGVQKVNGGSNPPTMAVGFCATYDDGTKEYWWVLSCKFAEITKKMKTEGETIEYQTPTIEAECIPLKNTGDLAVIADSNDSGITASVLTNWFNAVYLPGASAAPGVNDLPVGQVLAVASLPTTGTISIHTIYVLTAQDGTKAAGTMWRKMGDTWTQYGA